MLDYTVDVRREREREMENEWKFESERRNTWMVVHRCHLHKVTVRFVLWDRSQFHGFLFIFCHFYMMWFWRYLSQHISFSTHPTDTRLTVKISHIFKRQNDKETEREIEWDRKSVLDVSDLQPKILLTQLFSNKSISWL